MCLQRAMAEEVPWGAFEGLKGRCGAFEFIAVLGGKEWMIQEVESSRQKSLLRSLHNNYKTKNRL